VSVSQSDDRAYLDQVMADIAQEVRLQRASGNLPARVERELDELFLEYSPVAGRGGGLGDALRLVDAASFIDPVVPIISQKSGGAVVKKGLRTATLWYMGYVTHQVSVFASAVGRAMHLLENQLTDIRRQLDTQVAAPAQVVSVGWANGPDAWWVDRVTKTLASTNGRVLHAACDDGWLVRALGSAGIDAYGVDPRPGRIERAELDGTDLREDDVADHLRASASGSLGGIVLTGVIDGMTSGERTALLHLVMDRLAPDGELMVHSLSPLAWASEDLPPEADLSSGRPLRRSTWEHLLEGLGFDAQTHDGPDGMDYLVTARFSRPQPITR
jgi:hypothetical protein